MPYKDYEKCKQSARENYYKNREKKKLQAKTYYYNNLEKRKEQKKLWAEKNRDKLKAYRRIWWRHYDKKKKKAQWTLHNAIRSGKIKRKNKCEICNKIGLLHGHHEDYNKPLVVKWICHQCHFRKHWR